jgi:hypothetical protein
VPTSSLLRRPQRSFFTTRRPEIESLSTHRLPNNHEDQAQWNPLKRLGNTNFPKQHHTRWEHYEQQLVCRITRIWVTNQNPRLAIENAQVLEMKSTSSPYYHHSDSLKEPPNSSMPSSWNFLHLATVAFLFYLAISVHS